MQYLFGEAAHFKLWPHQAMANTIWAGLLLSAVVRVAGALKIILVDVFPQSGLIDQKRNRLLRRRVCNHSWCLPQAHIDGRGEHNHGYDSQRPLSVIPLFLPILIFQRFGNIREAGDE